MPATSSLRDCAQLVTATQEAGGQIPKSLATSSPARTCSTPARRPGRPRPPHRQGRSRRHPHRGQSSTSCSSTTAHQQMVNAYAGELRQRSERLFVEEFHKALERGLRRAVRQSETDLG